MLVHERLHYIGPNRRSRRTVIEWLLELEPGEAELVRADCAGAPEALAALLRAAGIDGAGWFRDTVPGTGPDPLRALCRLAGRLAVRLQQAAGHEVHHHAVVAAASAERCRLVFEYEHDETGYDAGEIALRLIAGAIPGLRWVPDANVPGAGAAEALKLFLERARATVLPRDAQAIIDAAARLDVPSAKLEREPYEGVSGAFRIRPHGLLRLGHARHLRVVDGTLCLQRSAHLVPMLFDRERLLTCMHDLGLPLPQQGGGGRPMAAARRLARAAAELGYPVVLKPVKRQASALRGRDNTRPALVDEAALLQEIERLRGRSAKLLLERHVTGETWHLLAAGAKALCAVRGSDGAVVTDAVHESLFAMLDAAAAKLDCGLLVLSVVTPDLSQSLEAVSGAVVNIDPAPQLDLLLPPDSQWLAAAAEAFVRWIFPDGAPSRIPLVAVTGTNGKTTTSRLIARMARESGLVPGLASTAGVYIDDVLRQAGDSAGDSGHHLLLQAREVDFGVLETARGGIAHSGFMFDRCDVGVCLNVTADHIGEYGIETLDDMVAVKRSIVERARHGVVLNADYPTCLVMLPFAAGVRVGLCSVRQRADELLVRAGAGGLACVLESAGAGDAAEEWLVCHEAGQRIPVLAVKDFPAAFGGAARFNLSNAQHAILAARLAGLGFDAIARALRGFDASFENNPGRLNFYHGHPFTVIMDYAHNPDGMHQLLDCADRLGIAGRRILLYAATGNRTDAEVVEHTLGPVGRIDHFVVRRYVGNLRGRQPEEIPELMHAALREAGVPEERITIAWNPEEGAMIAMRMARPGDLVILSPGSGEFETMWQQILGFRSEPAGDA